MTEFGQIPTAIICRFQELSKREIIVLSFLYASRNRKTGQCNPRQKQIADWTGLWPSHVSPALRSLESKGFIFMGSTGNFALTEPEEVTETVTKSYQNGNTEVTESVTKVTETVSPHNIQSMNIEVTQKERAAHPGMQPSVYEHPASVLYEEKFCIKVRNNFAKEIASRVSDLGIWSRLLSDKAAYADRPLADRERVANWILQEYDKRVAESQKPTYGTPKQSYQDRRAELASESFNRTAEIRRRVEQRDRELSRTALPDSRSVLQLVEPDADRQRESGAVGFVGAGVDGHSA